MKRIFIGSDPEVFLRDKNTGLFVSAHGQFPGTKSDPFPLDRGALQVDGHALEFNTEPVDNEDEFVKVINHVYRQVRNVVEETNPNWEIALEPVAHFDPEYFASLPAESKELGCSPDYSTVTGEILSAPDIHNVPIRTGSGHIHIGWGLFDEAFQEEQFKKRLEVARKVTPYLLEVSKGWETQGSVERRNYYGRDGAFRPKHYGVELRALDNLWLANDDHIRQVFRTTVEAVRREFGDAL